MTTRCGAFSCLVLFVVLLCFGIICSILITLSGNCELVAVIFLSLWHGFRTFVRFALVWVCLLPLPLRVWEVLRFVSGKARRGSTIDFHLLWHTVELAMSTRLCLL